MDDKDKTIKQLEEKNRKLELLTDVLWNSFLEIVESIKTIENKPEKWDSRPIMPRNKMTF